MGRLLNPGPGELADRLVILQLKLAFAPRDAVVDHFLNERRELQLWLSSSIVIAETRDPPIANFVSVWLELLTRLAAVNAVLWQLEDQTRGWRAASVTRGAVEPGQAAVWAALSTVQALNDERNGVVNEINRLFGLPSAPEKVR